MQICCWKWISKSYYTYNIYILRIVFIWAPHVKFSRNKVLAACFLMSSRARICTGLLQNFGNFLPICTASCPWNRAEEVEQRLSLSSRGIVEGRKQLDEVQWRACWSRSRTGMIWTLRREFGFLIAIESYLGMRWHCGDQNQALLNCWSVSIQVEKRSFAIPAAEEDAKAESGPWHGL